ncbi:MAG: CsbD family protein [Candidatus Delongbacteria bacterium]
MNLDQAAGKWEQLKGRAKMAWGELTDDDFTKAEGSADKLFGVIQEKFGDDRETIKAKLDKARKH